MTNFYKIWSFEIRINICCTIFDPLVSPIFSLDEYFKDRCHFREKKNSLSFEPLLRISITIYMRKLHIQDDTVSVCESRFSPRFFTRIESCIAGILADILNGFVPFPWNPYIFRSRRGGGRTRRETRHHFHLVPSFLVSDHRRQSCDRETTRESSGSLQRIEMLKHCWLCIRFYGFEIWKTISNSDFAEKGRGIRELNCG